jgi:hypothetical protein
MSMPRKSNPKVIHPKSMRSVILPRVYHPKVDDWENEGGRLREVVVHPRPRARPSEPLRAPNGVGQDPPELRPRGW